MSIIFTITICTLSIILGKLLFDRWFNHISLFSLNWSLFIVLYELKLINYVPISSLAWMVMIVGYISFLLGIITIMSARKALNKKNRVNVEHSKLFSNLFINEGKNLKIIAYVVSFIGLISTFYNWNVLINKFGSIQAVIIQSNIIYQMRINNEIKGTLPYVEMFLFVGIVLSSIYTAYKSKFSILPIISFTGILLLGIAFSGRANILLAFFLFFITFIFTRELLHQNNKNKKVSKYKFVVPLILVLVLSIGSVTIIRQFRGTLENFSAISPALKKFNKSVIITPSIYLYFSSDIGVLSKYLEHDNERTRWGENTFISVYNILSKFNVTRRPDVFSKGYYTPVWSNTGTFLREVHTDFGYAGILIFPYVLGLLTTFFWVKLIFDSDFRYFIPVIFFYALIGYSTIMLVTHLPFWTFSPVILIFILKYLGEYNAKILNKKNCKINP
ncbi:MAG: O-antigen polymerase [bacterium]